ncbi:ANTAR domain-containing protein [Egibacter rhizosphaerae]|uniref:ANTAR domain-containing protein n=1 Tax=Egibacter rhizosphaerae TaxID=1670831 RepID=A0A411YB11_9ACTN|nr:GAF and ANTAR domain-containing protein [Egibacter rhizosphaerae]QBI18394.1 ANTAR domain-containing protein [Egibacter rhizosphaerae]
MTEPDRVVHAMVELTDLVAEDFDLLEVLYVLSARAAELSGSTAAGVLALDEQHDEFSLAAATSRDVRCLELFEAQGAYGPSRAAYHARSTVIASDLSDSYDEWPEFVEKAVEARCRSLLVAPIQRRGVSVGTLTVLREVPGSFGADVEAIVDGLARIAAIALLTERTARSAQERRSSLARVLEGREVVEQAQREVATQLGVPLAQAFDRLRRYAREHDTLLQEAADRVVSGRVEAGALPHL